MKQKLITLAVAAAMVAPLAASAETTLYGRLDNALIYADDDIADGAWDVSWVSSRIGVKGSEDLGNGLKAIFQAEWAFDSSEGGSISDNDGDGNLVNRLGYVGLNGGFGTVAIGRQWTPYYGAVDKFDVFNNSATVASIQGTYLGLTRTGNALSYFTPNFSGFQGKLALILDRDFGGGDSDNIDAWNPAIDYNNGPISVGASYLGYNNDIDGQQDRWGISGSYNFGMFKLIAAWEDKDESDLLNVGQDDGSDAWNIVGEAYFGNNTLRAQYGQERADKNTVAPDKNLWAVGFQHNFSKATRVYAEYVSLEEKNKGTPDLDQSEFALGLRHDF